MTIVTGFLGAGKTTQLNAWLAELERERVVVIVNELGAIGIDGELLSGAGGASVQQITGGCVCCTTQLELARALDEIAGRAAPPESVFVETSGAASPAGVLRALTRGQSRDAFRLDGLVAVVDATRLEVLQEHDLAAEQLAFADVVILSRADLLDAAALEGATKAVLARNGAAVVAHVGRGLAPASLASLLAERSLGFRVVPASSEAAHRHYASVALSHPGELDEDLFAEWVETELAPFEGRLLRVKGILAIAQLDTPMILQGVAGTLEISFGPPWGSAPRTSRLVLVGFGLDRERLEQSFSRCAIRAA